MRRLKASPLMGLMLSVLIGSSWQGAQAESLKCAAPPYGDAAWNYTRLKARFANVDEDKLDDLLEKLCEAKFERVGRPYFHRLGITDRELAKKSTTALAAEILSTKHKS